MLNMDNKLVYDLCEASNASLRKTLLEGTFVLNEFQVPFNPEVNAENNWANPDIRPNRFDQTFENWFIRIGSWGRVEIWHTDPGRKVSKHSIMKETFVKLIATADLVKLYGQFSLELRGINEVDFIRVYTGADGKEYQEVFKVKVDLKKELKRGFHWWDGLFK